MSTNKNPAHKSPFTSFWSHRSLILQMIQREVVGRYRGSWLGLVWSFLTPLFMLAVYTFVFGTVFKARWSGLNTEGSMAEFAIILFAGLIIFQLFAEIINGAPRLILSKRNYVKKVVFPLEILPFVSLGSALFHTLASILILTLFTFILHGSLTWTIFLLPLVIAPFGILLIGLSWLFASLGVYMRDISQILAPLVTAAMFLSPIFFPITALPGRIGQLVILNPITLPVLQIREVLIFGTLPDFKALGIYTAIALAIAGFGFWWFQRTRKGFADVI